ncbi:MAG: hypothetical protein LUD76_10600 [Alistipes sp.]|nr:hypothetical protein [Alistipes sp.]
MDKNLKQRQLAHDIIQEAENQGYLQDLLQDGSSEIEIITADAHIIVEVDANGEVIE